MRSFFLFGGLEDFDFPEEEESEDDQEHDAHTRWRRLAARHALVRQARSFVRSCDSLGRRLDASMPGQDREARLLARQARRVPRMLAEALLAEVNGAEHRDCDPACVAYDIQCLDQTRRHLVKSSGLLERLLARYPSSTREIIELLDEAAGMETTVSARMVDMVKRWLQKDAA